MAINDQMIGTIADLSNIIGISSRQIREHQAQGHIPRYDPSRVDLWEAARHYVHHLRSIRLRREGLNPDDFLTPVHMICSCERIGADALKKKLAAEMRGK